MRPAERCYVQYGCGWSAPKEWVNYDASPTLKWERIPILGRYTKEPGQRRMGDRAVQYQSGVRRVGSTATQPYPGGPS
jgi:hypothetical protein